MKESPYTVASLAKGLRILSLFSEKTRRLRLKEIAEYVDLPVPTVFRLLKTLELEGYVEQDTDNMFLPGPSVLTLGFAALQSSSLAEAARLPLREFADQTGETVNLGVLVGSHVLYLDRIRNQNLVTANLQIGSQAPAACTSMGKLLLASLSPEELDERLPLIRLEECQGPRAASSIEELRRDLHETRDRGWALQDEQIAHGIRSVAAPVRNHAGEIVAAINLAVPSARWSMDQLIDKFLDPTRQAAVEISRRLGYVAAGAELAL